MDLRRQPQYKIYADGIVRSLLVLPESFTARTLVSFLQTTDTSMITNALRHLEEIGVVHATGEKTAEGATGRRKVPMMVWRKGLSSGPRVIARKGGNTHVPPSEALLRLGHPSPHNKGAEIQACMAAGIRMENIAGENEQPVYYVPRAWLDEHAPAIESPVEAEAREAQPMDASLAAEVRAISQKLDRLITLFERSPGRTASLFPAA